MARQLEVGHNYLGIRASALQWTGDNINAVERFLKRHELDISFRIDKTSTTLGLLDLRAVTMMLFDTSDWILVEVNHKNVLKQTNAQLQNDWRVIN